MITLWSFFFFFGLFVLPAFQFIDLIVFADHVSFFASNQFEAQTLYHSHSYQNLLIETLRSAFGLDLALPKSGSLSARALNRR